MSGLTKTAFSVLALSGLAAFAGTMGPECTQGSVTVPCETIAWNFGVSALYLQPVYDADFGYYNVVSESGFTRGYQDYRNPWEWGFKLEGSYHWGPGNDINVSWYRLRANTGDNDFGPITIGGAPVLSGIFGRESDWDALNGEFAQSINAGNALGRVHGGVQFAEIRTEEARIFPGGIDTDRGVFRKSEYNGFGPRAGFDGTYTCGNGFGIYAKSAAALLVGPSSFDNESTFETPLNSHGSKIAIVPELEAKLGVDWVYGLAQGDLTFDLGYMWFNYFNAQHNLNTSVAFGNESDFATSGLYFGVVYKGVV